MTTPVEVYADISCPFTHVGLLLIKKRLDELGRSDQLLVRAWPLEWVNGEPLAADAVEVKVAALREQVGTHFFTGFRPDRFPTTTIPALNLAAAAYDIDTDTGLAVSMELRHALFELGLDVSDPDVLADVARRHELDPVPTEAVERVRRDYAEGQARGVKGSPNFFTAEEEFFCPALDIDHDDTGHLVAAIDVDGISAFIASI